MPRKPAAPANRSIAARLIDAPDSSLLDVLDRALNKGVVAWGDVTLGVAGVDLIYLRLSALLGAADRVRPRSQRRTARRKRPTRRRR
jgi:hypothetical protein